MAVKIRCHWCHRSRPEIILTHNGRFECLVRNNGELSNTGYTSCHHAENKRNRDLAKEHFSRDRREN